MLHIRSDDPATNNGAPQVEATFFLAVFALMMLIPVARVYGGGVGDTHTALSLFHSDFGLNIFAILLVLVPIVGIAISMLLRPMWRLGAGIDALLGALLVPLAAFNYGHAQNNGPVPTNVDIALGGWVFIVLFLILAGMALIPMLRHLHDGDTDHAHAAHATHS